MNKQEIWEHIHSERAQTVETLRSLTPEQLSAPTLCGAWDVKEVVGHLLMAAEQTIPNFYKELAGAGFSFTKFTNQGVTRIADLDPAV